MPANYTIVDLVGILWGFLLSPLVFVTPGYLLGWCFDLFQFKRRSIFAQILLGVVLSSAISPLLLFWLYRFTSAGFALVVLGLMAFLAALVLTDRFIQAWRRPALPPDLKHLQMLVVTLAPAWFLFCALFLVDWQFGSNLYFTSISYDYTTRVSMIDAIFRSGHVPPVNPGYYPGQPIALTFLYYFWYIPGSVLELAGGSLISSYQALIVSVGYTGLSLAGVLALYLRLRNRRSGLTNLKNALVAVQFFFISGLDFIPVLSWFLIFFILARYLPMEGRLEAWNMPVMSWMDALSWVPNHVAATVACLTGFLLFIDTREKAARIRFVAAIFAAACFASALGMSVWVTLVFLIFWVLWLGITFFQGSGPGQSVWMILPGIAGLLLAFPFIYDLLKGGGGASQVWPVEAYVRPFFLTAFFTFVPERFNSWLDLLFLPLNYFLELGFFAVIAYKWLRCRLRENFRGHPYHLPEALLCCVVLILMSFFHSVIISVNDLGIRGWLPLQFILIVWAMDLFPPDPGQMTAIIPLINKLPTLGEGLRLLLVIGLLTTLLEVLVERSWNLLIDAGLAGTPHEVGPDTHIGERTYFARLAYEYAGTHLPANDIYQNNPAVVLDRPSGLYGMRQMVISDRTVYGVSADQQKALIAGISPIFTTNPSDWHEIDATCARYKIDVLVIDDLDLLWKSLPVLETVRAPLYQNKYYALVACGNQTSK